MNELNYSFDPLVQTHFVRPNVATNFYLQAPTFALLLRIAGLNRDLEHNEIYTWQDA